MGDINSEHNMNTDHADVESTDVMTGGFDQRMEKYLRISDQNHIKKIIQMPVHFLLQSGKGFFVKKDDSVLSLRDDLKEIIHLEVLNSQFKDVIEYRTMDYYKRRYQDRKTMN